MLHMRMYVYLVLRYYYIAWLHIMLVYMYQTIRTGYSCMYVG